MDRDEIKIKEELVSKNLLSLLDTLNVFSRNLEIGLFAPMSDEVNVLPSLIEHNDKFSFPCLNGSGEMIFRKSTFENLVVTKQFGVDIHGPCESAVEVSPDILLVPALAFGRSGERLGRGRGYYDKYLENFNNITIGLGLSDQIIEDIPMEKHDCFMNWIVTDKEVIKI
jgi:5-formyltetrahydrofolate cyclo-ligase